MSTTNAGEYWNQPTMVTVSGTGLQPSGIIGNSDPVSKTYNHPFDIGIPKEEKPISKPSVLAKNLKGWVIRQTGYQINLSEKFVEEAQFNITTNKPLTPETVGFILGQAVPIFEKVKCKFCHKPMRIDDEHIQDPSSWTKQTGLHKACYMVIKSSREGEVKIS